MEQPLAGSFAQRLRTLRERAALTQEELAERAGLTANAIGALERGERRRPYPHTVRALGEALELDEADRAALAAAARPATGQPPEDTARVDLDARPNSFSAPATPLLGREVELAEVVARLRAKETRLLTLTGPGGVGKTRLALAATAELLSDFPDGVAVAELAPVSDHTLVLRTAAAALGMQQTLAADMLGQLASFVGSRRALLLLDNVEHVLGAAPDVADLLARCPTLVVLATGRAPLRLRAEQELPLAPLTLPEGSNLSALLASPAGQMFLDRAHAAAAAYPLTADSAPIIVEICRRLDGLPLALELAAAHARLLDPATLLKRLDQAVGAGRSRDLPERQQTMQATLDWSHALLTRDEQRLLDRLSVFAGGFTLPAAERVAGSGLDVFGALTGLAEQSLIVAPDEHGRYRLLEPIRQYAAARLRESGEAPVIGAAHLAYFGELATSARKSLQGPDQGAWLDDLQREHANLRAAAGFALESGNNGAAALLLGHTWLYWALRGHAGEGLGWLDSVLAEDQVALTDEEQLAAQAARAALRWATGDIAGTTEAGMAAVRSGRTAGNRALLAEAMVIAGSGAAFGGELDRATAILGEAAALAAELDDVWGQAHVAMAQGQVQLLAGDGPGSLRILAEGERLARRLDGPFSLAVVLNIEATLDLLAGRTGEALERLLEAAALAAEVDITWTLVYTVPGLAALAAGAGLPELSVRFFGAAAALAESSGIVVSFPPDVERAERSLALARRQLDASAFDRAWDSGRTLRPAAVAELAEPIRGRLGRSATQAPRTDLT